MPYFYDLEFGFTVTTAETTQMAGKQVAAGQTVGIYGLMMNARSLTAGGASGRTKTNTAGGTVFSGGTAQTPAKKDQSQAPAAQSTWVNAGSAITAGTTLVVRNSVGFAQTGGQGGMQPIAPQAAVQLQGGTTPNPVDVEFTNISATATVAGDMTAEIGEGI